MTEGEPSWYKDAVIYELHVRAFADSNGDGIGDFAGLKSRLDYLQDLGVTALWLLPFYPSPLKDDGYDIADYTGVHPSYGTMADFREFLQEAHARGLRVITELVLNHTSDQHAWFQRARRAAPGTPERDFYVWSDTPERYTDARIIFKDFEASNWAWDPVAKAYYWHRFYSHQPDLNFDNPAVRDALKGVLDFWLEAGVDGVRLDAVPYLYEREGTICENLAETHEFLKELRRHVDSRYKDRLFLAEANQWPEDAAAYFGAGDECHMNFHFPLMPRLFMASRMEDRFPIIDILQQTPAIPENCQWALFLRNHDELTLEMVTDEDRDYMYRVYAEDPQARINLGIRRRLAPLLGNNRRRIELMNGLLFSLPGTPVLYYGDEIGMGDNIYLGDRNGVRTPMQWSADRNAGFSRANPQRLYLPVITEAEYHYEALNVEAQQNNPHSLLWWTKRLIALRKRYKAFGRGALEFLHPENRKILAFVRRLGEESILVVANLSRFVQGAELDLSSFKGLVPVELFGRTELPPVGEQPYFLTMGPHAFYWFKLEPARRAVEVPSARERPLVRAESLDDALLGRSREALSDALASYLRACGSCGARAEKLKGVSVLEALPLERSGGRLVLAWAEYAEGEPEAYLLPLAWAPPERAALLAAERPQSAVARLRLAGQEGLLYESLWDPGICEELLQSVLQGRRLKGRSGEARAWAVDGLLSDGALQASVRMGQNNPVITYGDRFVLKLFRRIEPGPNPDLELGRHLARRAGFRHSPALTGAIEYSRGGQAMTLGVLSEFVRSESDGWRMTLDAIGQYLERVIELRPELPQSAPPGLLAASSQDPPAAAAELIGPYLASARLIGRRTGEMHEALGGEADDPAFAPEPFTDHYRMALYHGLLGQMEQTLRALKGRIKSLGEPAQSEARTVLERAADVKVRFTRLRGRRIRAARIRCHGDLHLGQLLFTGKDFVIIDFEGDPTRPLGWRRLKRSPLRDVASMLRSFHHAAGAALYGRRSALRPEDAAGLEPWAALWHRWVSAAFLREYLAVCGQSRFLPQSQPDLSVLLEAYLMERCLNELGVDLVSKPERLSVSLRGILQILEAP